MACKHQGVKLNVYLTRRILEGLPVGSIFAARFVGDKNTKKTCVYKYTYILQKFNVRVLFRLTLKSLFFFEWLTAWFFPQLPCWVAIRIPPKNPTDHRF